MGGLQVELLRVAADRRALKWIHEFLNDPDEEIQFWGFGIVDQLLFSELVEEEEVAHIIEFAETNLGDNLRENIEGLRNFLRCRNERWAILQKRAE